MTINKQGYRQLLKMGWREGHGLGKMEQGMLKPVEIDVSRNRFGLGFTYHFCDGYDEELNKLDTATEVEPVLADLNLNDRPGERKQEPVQNRQSSVKPIVLRRQKGIGIRELINNIHKMLANFMSSLTENDLVFDKSLTIEDRKLVHKEAHKLGLKTRSEGQGENRFLVVSKKRSANEILESAIQSGQISKYKLISKGDHA